MTERTFAYDTVELDSSKIESYEHDIYGPVTVFKDVVIAREIVQKYDDGMAYKSADELEAAYWTADGMWAISGGHPNTMVIMDRDQMQGKTVHPRFVKNLNDPKTRRPNNRGIVADLEVYDSKISPETLVALKSGAKSDVSIGFFFFKDEVAGSIDEDGHPLNGSSFDYSQRNIAINHLAFGLDSGRCPMPFCGIGADEIMRQVAGDPFGKWQNMSECIKDIMKENPNYTEEQAAATCAKIEKQSKAKKDMVEEMLNDWKKSIDEVLSKFEEIESEDAGTPKTEAERAMAHFNISPEKWAELSEEEKQEYINKLPPPGQKRDLKEEDDKQVRDEAVSDEDLTGLLKFYTLTQENWDDLLDETRITLRSLYTERAKEYENADPTKMAGGEEPGSDEAEGDELSVWIDEWILENVGEDAVMSYAAKKALPDSAYAYIESGCEKEDGKTAQKCRHLPIHDKAHVQAALAALGGARTGKVPPYASKAKPKVCAAARKFKIESEVCGTKGDEEKVVAMVPSKSTEELLKRQRKQPLW